MAIATAMLRRLRIENGLTQRELGELVGVSQAHIAKIESGKVDPRLSTVNRILKVLTESRKRKCSDIMSRNLFFARPHDSVLKVSKVMIKNGISQMPVLKGDRILGTITERTIVRNLSSGISDERVGKIMGSPLPTVPENTSMDLLRVALERHQAVLVTRNRKIIGVISRSDILKTIGQ